MLRRSCVWHGTGPAYTMEKARCKLPSAGRQRNVSAGAVADLLSAAASRRVTVSLCEFRRPSVCSPSPDRPRTANTNVLTGGQGHELGYRVFRGGDGEPPWREESRHPVGYTDGTGCRRVIFNSCVCDVYAASSLTMIIFFSLNCNVLKS